MAEVPPPRRFNEPPPTDYQDVPGVLRWLVRMALHMDDCFDSRLSRIEAKEHDAGVMWKTVRSEGKLLAAAITAGITFSQAWPVIHNFLRFP